MRRPVRPRREAARPPKPLTGFLAARDPPLGAPSWPLRGRLQSLPTNTKPHKYLKSTFQVCKSLRGHADHAVFLSETYGSGPTYDEDLATIRRAADDARRWLRDVREPTLEEAMARVDEFRAVALPPLKVRRRARPPPDERKAGPGWLTGEELWGPGDGFAPRSGSSKWRSPTSATS